MEQKKRIGVIGLGQIGSDIAASIDKLGASLVGADADETNRQQFEAEYDGETYDTPEALCEADVDGICVTTPNKFHESATTVALEAGLDVLIAKPLAHSLQSAERIAEAARASEASCVVGYHHRYHAECEIVKRYIEEGYFGDILHIDAKFLRRRGVPGRGTWFTSKDIAGGGALLDIGSYDIDLILYFLDYPELRDLTATVYSGFGHRPNYSYLEMYGQDAKSDMFDVEDSAMAMLEFEGDTTATVEAAWAINDASCHELRILGTEAGAVLELPVSVESGEKALFLAESRGGAELSHFVDSEVTAPDRDALQEQAARFLDIVSDDITPMHNTVDQALAVQRLVEQIYDEAED